jgi:hypothetical protein
VNRIDHPTRRYAYNSNGRLAVNAVPVKGFDDRFDTATLQRQQRDDPTTLPAA